MDYDYLSIDNNDKQVLKHLSEMGEQLKTLFTKVQEAQANLDYAKKEYEHYACVVIPSEMHAAGLESITLASGGTLKVVNNFYCSPNKNPMDQKIMVDWLREHNGGHIVKSEAKVSSEDIEALASAHIPFVEETSVNTQKLKSFLKDGIGITSGQQNFTIDDIPACLHFQQVSSVEIEI